jgi:hypothetical protein
LVNGYWVGGVDLASVYQAAGVRPALLAALGTNGPQLIDQALVSADRLTLVFTPATVGRIVLPEFATDITTTLGLAALQHHMTDVGPVVVIIVVAASGLGLLAMTADIAWNVWERLSMAYYDYTHYTGPDKDFDGDKKLNKDDEDDDNDGYNDDEDNYPYDPTRHICDCGRPRAAISFTTGTAGDYLPSLVSVLNATHTQKAGALSLGAITSGRAPTLALVF